MYFIILIICSMITSVVSLKKIEPKICKKCKYFINDFNTGEFGKCSYFSQKNEENIKFLVTGVYENKYEYCCTARKSEEMCGLDAKHYKKK